MEISKETNVFDTRQICFQGYEREGFEKTDHFFSRFWPKTEIIEMTTYFYSST